MGDVTSKCSLFCLIFFSIYVTVCILNHIFIFLHFQSDDLDTFLGRRRLRWSPRSIQSFRKTSSWLNTWVNALANKLFMDRSNFLFSSCRKFSEIPSYTQIFRQSKCQNLKVILDRSLLCSLVPYETLHSTTILEQQNHMQSCFQVCNSTQDRRSHLQHIMHLV